MHPCSGLTDREAAFLSSLAAGRNCLELGALFGASAVAMARDARVVWSVDWHHGDEFTGPQSSLGRFMANIEDAGVAERVVAVVGRFDVVGERLRSAAFELVHVDGAHDYASVYRDMSLAWNLCAPGGYVSVHDFDRFDVTEATAAFAGAPFRVIDSLAYWLR